MALQINLFGTAGAGAIVTTDAYATVVSDIGISWDVALHDNGSHDTAYVGVSDNGV